MGNNKIEQTLRRMAWVAGLVITAVLVISAVEYKKNSMVRAVNIVVQPPKEGQSLITKEDLQLLLSRSFPGDLHENKLEEVDLDRMERVLEEDPFVDDADAFIDAANQLHLHVTQREPIVRIIDKLGKSYYLDQTGEKMPLSRHFTARVPVATGSINPFDPNYLNNEKDDVYQVFGMAKKLTSDPFFQALVEQIHLESNKVIYLVPKIGSSKIRFGKWNEVDERFERLKVYYQEILPHTGWNKYDFIDVQFEGQVVCQK